MFGYEYYAGYGYYYDESNDPLIPFPGSSNTTTYVPKYWSGVDSSISISNIEYSNNRVSFYVHVPTGEVDYPVIANPGNGVYNSGDSFELSLVEAEARPVSSVEWYFDDEPVYGTSVLLRGGEHMVEAVITLASGESMTVTLEIIVEE